jgi:nitroreductase
MQARWTVMAAVVSAGVLVGTLGLAADTLKTAQLPPPQTDGGKPLMQVLKARKSSREFSPEPISAQIISNMLWAAFGINRADTGGRTAPSAMNWQEIDVYVAMGDGLYLYVAKTNILQQILAEDIRAKTGSQPFVKDAPLALIFVADYGKIKERMTIAEKDVLTAADTGFVSQNVYLYCASEGLATVVRVPNDKLGLKQAMKLRQDQQIVLAQSVGLPKK